jgi:hypothetical protein
MARSAKHFVVIKAVREIRKEIEKAGIENLKLLANSGKSIVGTYLNGCSAPEKAMIKRDFNALLKMGVTIDMIVTELARQMPDLAPIMESKQELQNFEVFLKG